MAWYDDHIQLADFADACMKVGIVEEATDVIRKPYKFQAYFDKWAELDYPGEEDENWDAWVEAVTDEEPD